MNWNGSLESAVMDQNKHSTCLVILVNWRRAEDTISCLESLDFHQQVGDLVVAVCENGSVDGSDSLLRGYLKSHGVESSLRCDERDTTAFAYGDGDEMSPSYFLVLSETNRGFSGGNNLAYRVASAHRRFDYVWFLNNDTEVEPDTLSLMLARMRQDARIGICGSTLVYAHDRKTVQALGGAVYWPWTGLVSELGQGGPWPQPVNQAAVEARMSYVSGASMLTSAVFLERVGLMSEDYFLYYEEIDWAVRARRAGFRLGYASDAVVYHKEGAALGSGKSSQRSALAEYYGMRNKLVITRKFFPWALPTVLAASWLQVVKRLIQGQWLRARLMAAVLLGLQRSAPRR